MAAPRCFISYSWDNDEHKDWVRCLATELQRNGVETRLDQWDTHPGMDVTNYMETCIRESDFVLGNSQIIIYHPPVAHTGLLIDNLTEIRVSAHWDFSEIEE